MAETTKIEPTSPRLTKLLSDVENGSIKIPVFQREFVWDDEQVMSLLDSIYHGYPVGSLLLWSTKQPLKYNREVGGFKLPDVPEDYPVLYVLDDQQRLTTLYGVFNSSADTDNPELAKRFSVCFDPETEMFIHESAADPQTTIFLRDLLDTSKVVKQLARFDTTQQERITTAIDRFKDYEFPVVTIKGRSNQEVCQIFQRINSSGTSLSPLELLAAWTWSDQFDLRREIEALVDRLGDKGFDDLGDTQIMRCLAAIVRNDISTDALVEADPEQLIQGMTKLKEAMNATVDFLDSELKIKNSTFLPFPIMIVPLARFFAENRKPDAQRRKRLRRWFWHCAFTQRYKAGTNKHVLEDLERMRSLAEGGDEFGSLTASVNPNLFKTWRINSTVAKAAICLYAQLRPRSFLTGQPIDLGTTLEAYNAREYHHIYPKAFLAEQDIPFHQSNVIANVCMLTSSDNKAISAKDPAVYFKEVPDEMRDKVFDSALIPANFRGGGKPFTDFVDARADLLAETAERLVAEG